MATSKELAESIKLTLQLTELEKSIAAHAIRTNQVFVDRVSTFSQLEKLAKDFSTSSAVDQMNMLVESVKAATSAMSGFSSSGDGLTSLLDTLSSAGSSVKPVKDDLAELVEQLGKVGTSPANDGLTSLVENLDKTGASSGALDEKFKKLGSASSGALSTGFVAAGAALHGLMKGLGNLKGLVVSGAGFMKQLASSAFKIGAAILSIPLQIFGALVKHAGETAGGIDELAVALEKVRKEFGAFSGPASSAVISTAKDLKGFSDTGLNAFRIFGTMAERLDYVREVAVAMGAQFGVMTTEFKANGGALLAYQKALGFSAEQMKSLGSLSIATGTKGSDILKEMGKYAYDLGKAFAVDSKLIGKDMAKALQDVKHFGGATVKQIAEAAVYSRKLGVELEKITGTLDAFETFDSAATNAAKLSQSFGVTVDAFKLMEAQSPAEQIEMLKKQFKSAGVDVSTFNRQQLKLLQTTTGLDEATAKQVFSLKNQGTSLDSIKRKSGESQKKQLTQLEVLTKLADNIERLIKSGSSMSGGFFDQFVKGFKDGVYWSQGFQQILRNIRIGLVQVYQAGFKLGQFFAKLPDVAKIFTSLQELFAPGKFAKLATDAAGALSLLFTGKIGVRETIEKIRSSFGTLFNTKALSSLKDSFKSFAVKAAKILGEGIQYMGEEVAKGMTYVLDLLTGKVAPPGTAGPSAEATEFVKNIVSPLAKGAKAAWKVLYPAVSDLLSFLGKSIVKFLKSESFMKFAAPIGAAMIGVVLGPVATHAAAALGVSLISSFGKMIITSGVPALIKAIVSSLGAASGPIGAAIAVSLSAIFISKGVDKFAKMLPSELSGAEKDFTAGVAGLVDAFTLGFLPDRWVVKVTMYLSKGFNSVVTFLDKKLVGYGGYLKEGVMSAFKVLQGIGDVIVGLFDGDAEKVFTGIGRIGQGVLRAVTNMAITIPAMMLQALTKIGKLVSTGVIDLIIRPFAWAFSKLSGTSGATETAMASLNDFKAKVQMFFDNISITITAGAGFIRDTMSTLLSGNISEMGNVKSMSTRIAELTEKAVKDGVKTGAAAAAPGELVVESLDKGNPQAFIEKSTELLKNAEEMKSKLSSFDVAPIQAAFDKLKTLSVDGLEGKVLPTIDAGLKTIKGITDVVAQAAGSLGSMGDLTTTVDKLVGPDGIVALLKRVGEAFPQETLNANLASLSGLKSFAEGVSAAVGNDLTKALRVITEIVKSANELESALSDGKLNTGTIQTKLNRVAETTKFGSNTRYTIENKAVQINVNLQVTMDVGEVEKVIVLRKESIVRDRINFLSNKTGNPTGNVPGSTNEAFSLVNNDTRLHC